LCTELSTEAAEKNRSWKSGLKDKANPEMKYSDKIELTEIQCLQQNKNVEAINDY
jgi:hypothetical protein